MKSWKTTLGGLLVAMSPFILVAGNCLLGTCDFNEIFTEANKLYLYLSSTSFSLGAVINGYYARDKNVSSESEGAK